MTTTALPTISTDFGAEVDRLAADFDSFASDTKIAARTVARLRARGLDVEWATGDTHWQSRRDEKVGCFVSDRRGNSIWKHEEFTAFFDIQGLSKDGVEVIVRVRASRLGKAGKLRAEVLVGAYVGGGLDACGRHHEPRFLHDSLNAPQVKAARALLGLS